MNKQTLLLFTAVLMCTFVYAENPDYRFGKVSENELRMTSYDKDPEAEAVILYEDSSLDYPITSVINRMINYRTRIKILKQEGTDAADVSIAYIYKPELREVVSSIDAVSYNLENGKIVKTPLKRQYIFTERIDDNHMCVKFSIPEVRVGTVIEYRYNLSSPNITYLPSLVFQHGIPVIYSRWEVAIPEFFKVRIDLKGHQHIDITESLGSGSIHGNGGNLFSYTTRIIKATAEHLPALKKEPFVWCLNDFRSKLDFELSEIAFPGSPIQSFTASWESVNEALDKSSFSTSCKINNPFKDEVAAIKAKTGTAREKAREVLKLVQSKIKWNGDYRLFSERPRAAVTAGNGTSADINFVLMAALKDAGFKVVPILLSPRHMGRLPFTRATINGIEAFIVRITLDDGEYAYADASEPNSDLDILPSELLVDRARIYGINGEAGWCDLSKLTQGMQSANMILNLNPDGTISGRIIEEFKNLAALNTSRNYTQAQSEEEYIEHLEKEQNITIENLQITGIGTSTVQQKYDMTFTPNVTDDYVYLNAAILPFMSTNPLEAQTRTLPIEFEELQAYNIRCSLTLPKGYVVEELPKNISMTTCEQGHNCRYMSMTTPTTLQFNLVFSTKRLVYLPKEYPDLKTFFGMVVDLNNSQIVIRKSNAS